MKPNHFLKRKLFVLFLAISLVSFAQQDPDYKFELGKVKWMKMTDAGTLVVSTNQGLYGIEPNKTTPSFSFERRKNIKEENFHLLPGTPYAKFIANGLNKKTFVLDLITGKVLFDSNDMGYSAMYSSHVVLPENKLVISAYNKEKNGAEVAIFDLNSSKKEFTTKFKYSNPITGRPKLANGKMYIPRKKGLDCVDLASGSTLWTSDVDNIQMMDIEGNAIYAFEGKSNNRKHVIHKLDLNGKPLWEDGRKLKGIASQLDYSDKGVAILVHEIKEEKVGGTMGIGGKLVKVPTKSHINFLDANSGNDLWEKAPKTKGVVSHFYVLEDGILFGVASGGINKIKFDGTPLWRKPLKTGPNISTLAKTPKGILYISSKNADIIDENSGESVFGKKLKYKGSKGTADFFDAKNNVFYLSCSDGLYKIDGNTGENKIIAEPKFDGKETPSSIEMRGDNILLSSSQNMMLLDADGKEIYHEYFRAPGKSAFGVILMSAMALGSTYLATDSALRAGANRTSPMPGINATYNSYGNTMNHASKGFGSIAGASFAEMGKRFKASSQTKNDKFILTKLKSGVGLVKLDKDSGKTLKEIELKDKKPMYKVDEVEQILYYNYKDKAIYAYKF